MEAQESRNGSYDGFFAQPGSPYSPDFNAVF
jgi:hypothetical protein